jgi:transcriptional regulator with GAF, ATPase, and Fis domain
MTLAQQRITEVFVEVADSLTDDFDIIDLLQRLSERCVELLNVSAAGILLADPHGELQILAASDENARLLELFALQHDQGPCVECFRSGQAHIDIDLTGRGALTRWPRFTAQARQSGFVRTHAIPLRLRQRVIGALNLFQEQPGLLDSADQLLARGLADISTIAILQQRTVHHSQLESVQLQTALDTRIVVEQAKGILAERWHTSVDDAFAVLRAHARRHHLQITGLARRVIDGTLDTETLLRGMDVTPADTGFPPPHSEDSTPEDPPAAPPAPGL